MPETSCCPQCDSPAIYCVSPHTMHDKVSEHDWACRDCQHEFDDPLTRDAKNPLGQDDPTAPPEGTAARILHDMDPDEFGEKL